MYFEGVEYLEKASKVEREGVKVKAYPIPGGGRKSLFSEWGKLGNQMERLFSVVHRDRLKVIIFDDFVADAKGVEEVSLFLGIPLDGKNDFQTIDVLNSKPSNRKRISLELHGIN